jgi:hypothetical protein
MIMLWVAQLQGVLQSCKQIPISDRILPVIRVVPMRRLIERQARRLMPMQQEITEIVS